MDRLRVIPPYGKSFLHPIDCESLVVGRSATADLHVADRFLSRKHARLYFDHGCWWIEDLHSRNGSWVNGRRIAKPTEFGAGDRVRLSNTYLLFGPEPPEVERTPTDFFAAGAEVTYLPAEELSKSTGALDPAELDRATAVEKQAENLRLLNRLHKVLSEPIDLEGLLDMILDCAFESLPADQGVIYLRQPDGRYQRAAERARGGLTSHHFESETLLTKVADEGMTALVNGLDADSDWRSAESMHEQGVTCLIAAPFKDAQTCLGMIAISSTQPGAQFGKYDLELLVSLASIATMRVRNLLLTEQSVREAARIEIIEQELSLAREIQVRLLPSRVPRLEGYEFFGRSTPCQRVSGDFYEVVPRQEGEEVVVLVADVVGKGLPASLVTTSLDSLAAGPIEVGHPPLEICRRLDRRLFARTAPGKFAATLIVAVRAGQSVVRYANAGLNPGLLLRKDGDITRMTATGPPLGLLENADFEERSLELEPGDLLVLYTDGITEAVDRSDEEYGMDRLIDVCRRHLHQPLDTLGAAIEDDLASFTRGVPFEDDRTLVLARRLGSS